MIIVENVKATDNVSFLIIKVNSTDTNNYFINLVKDYSEDNKYQGKKLGATLQSNLSLKGAQFEVKKYLTDNRFIETKKFLIVAPNPLPNMVQTIKISIMFFSNREIREFNWFDHSKVSDEKLADKYKTLILFS